jgi:hypothetical protein
MGDTFCEEQNDITYHVQYARVGVKVSSLVIIMEQDQGVL